jgi:hypothetical protein
MKKNNTLLSNKEIAEVIPLEKKLQIVFQNETHISIVIPCSSSVVNETKNIFRIEGPYNLDCNEMRVFGYIEKFIHLRVDKCCEEIYDWPDIEIVQEG